MNTSLKFNLSKKFLITKVFSKEYLSHLANLCMVFEHKRLVLTLRSQFESIIGVSDAAKQRHLHFHKISDSCSFLFSEGIDYYLELSSSSMDISGPHYMMGWIMEDKTVGTSVSLEEIKGCTIYHAGQGLMLHNICVFYA